LAAYLQHQNEAFFTGIFDRFTDLAGAILNATQQFILLSFDENVYSSKTTESGLAPSSFRIDLISSTRDASAADKSPVF
jgi:hypothetical protein